MTDHILSDLLELYVLGRAAEADLAGIEKHLLMCECCRDLLSDNALTIVASQLGLPQVTGVVAVHATNDGVLIVSVTKVRKS